MATATAEEPRAKKANRKPASQEVMERYIEEIDRFAMMLRIRQDEIARLTDVCNEARRVFEDAKEQVREAKEQEHNTVSLLLKFIRPGSIEIMPLFDRMEQADDKVHGKDSTEWRQEPISSLGLSALAMRTLLDADIVLVGQLQDRVMTGPAWADDLDISEGIAQAIEAKLHQFIEERTAK